MLKYNDLTTFYKGQLGFISKYFDIRRFHGLPFMEINWLSV